MLQEFGAALFNMLQSSCYWCCIVWIAEIAPDLFAGCDRVHFFFFIGKSKQTDLADPHRALTHNYTIAEFCFCLLIRKMQLYA